MYQRESGVFILTLIFLGRGPLVKISTLDKDRQRSAQSPMPVGELLTQIDTFQSKGPIEFERIQGKDTHPPNMSI